jgi:hypothetical protein
LTFDEEFLIRARAPFCAAGLQRERTVRSTGLVEPAFDPWDASSVTLDAVFELVFRLDLAVMLRKGYATRRLQIIAATEW